MRASCPWLLHQVVGELHRHLARRPLARMVQAHHEEHGLAARLGALDVVRDLDAVDRATLERLVRQREPLDDARLDGRELAQVVVVVGQRPVGVPSARQRRGGDAVGVGTGRSVVLRGAQREVGDLDVVREPGGRQGLRVGGRVEHDLDEPGSGVLGQVEPETVEPVLVGGGGGVHPHELCGEGGRPFRCGGNRGESPQRQRGGRDRGRGCPRASGRQRWHRSPPGWAVRDRRHVAQRVSGGEVTAGRGDDGRQCDRNHPRRQNPTHSVHERLRTVNACVVRSGRGRAPASTWRSWTQSSMRAHQA